jgi:hypothetical protein
MPALPPEQYAYRPGRVGLFDGTFQPHLDQMQHAPWCASACASIRPPSSGSLSLRHRLVNDAPTDTNAAHEAPIAVTLTVLPYRRVAEVQAPNQI